MMKLSALLVCALGVAVLATDPPQRSNPGVRVRITKHTLEGVNNLVKKGVGLVSELIPLGLQYQVKGVSFGDAEFIKNEAPEVKFAFGEPNKLMLTVKGGNLKVKMPVTTVEEAPKKGTVTLHMHEHDDALALAFTEQATGKLGIEKAECKVEHQHFHVTVEGLPEDNEARLELEAFPAQVQMMSQMFCTMLDSYLGKAQLELAKHDFIANIEGFNIDYSLTSPPKATDDYMQMDFLSKVTFDKPSVKQTLVEIPYEPTAMPEGTWDRWFHFSVNDAVFNQIFNEGWRTGVFDGLPMFDECVKMFQEKAIAAGIYDEAPDATVKLNFATPMKLRFVEEEEVGVRLKGTIEVVSTKTVDGEEKTMTAVLDMEAEEGKNVNFEEPLKGDRLTITKVSIKEINGADPPIPEDKYAKIEEISKEVFQHLVHKLETKAITHLDSVDSLVAERGGGTEHQMAKEFVEQNDMRVNYYDRVAEVAFSLLVHWEKISGFAKASLGQA